jgi:haloalkane dehalogenase
MVGGPAASVARTPDERFVRLPDYPFEPRYAELPGVGGDPLRMHYLDEGPRDAHPVLLLHGQPTWSYLYRHVVPGLVARGHRVVAPDLVGFGRSDKPTDPTDYTVERHVGWLAALVGTLDLRHVTLVAQDWGGPIGLAVLAGDPDRFDRVVATNTILHTGDPALAGRIAWANHSDGRGRRVVEEALLDYVHLAQRAPSLRAGVFVQFATMGDVPEDVVAAYDAPFPDPRYQAGMRQFPALVPLTSSDPATALARSAWEALGKWERPFLTLYSDGDPATRGWDDVFCDHVPGAAGMPHATISGAGHFVQEDQGRLLARLVGEFVEGTPLR